MDGSVIREGNTMSKTNGTAAAAETAAAAGQGAAGISQELARQLAERAQAEGLPLTGPGGLLTQVTKTVLESALEGEMDDHLGYDKHDPAGRDGGNSRNGHRGQDGAHRGRAGGDRRAAGPGRQLRARSWSRKRQRRLSGVDDLVISLVGQGADHRGGRRAPGRGVRRARCPGRRSRRSPTGCWRGWPSGRTGRWTRCIRWCSSTRSTSRSATGRWPTGRSTWRSAVTVDGERDILGLWAGEHGDGEGAKYWLQVLTEIKNRGIARRAAWWSATG